MELQVKELGEVKIEQWEDGEEPANCRTCGQNHWFSIEAETFDLEMCGYCGTTALQTVNWRLINNKEVAI